MATRSYAVFAVGKRVAYLRKQRGWTQLELSLRSGVAKSYLSDLESGRRNPSVLLLEKICVALGCTLSTLFEGAGPAIVSKLPRLPGQP